MPGQNGRAAPRPKNHAQNRLLFRHLHLHVSGWHGIPHCHAIYGDYAGAYSIEDGQRMAGLMPPQQEKKIREFILTNQNDPIEKWHELSD
jgi:hypothetical protein